MIIDFNNDDNEVLDFGSGFIINYHHTLDGGGNYAKRDFVEIIQSLGKTYQNAMEWCAGHGAIGYELLTKNICKNIHFMDVFPPAIETCLVNAKRNNVEDRVFGYVSSTIQGIGQMPPIDLVVSNPPHGNSIEEWNKQFSNFDSHEYLNGVRLGVDDQFKIHEEFFANIIPRLAPDADILLSENCVIHPLIDKAKLYGLTCVNIYDNVYAKYKGQTIHLKVKV